MAVIWARTTRPTTSNRLRAPSEAPERPNTKVPTRSSAVSSCGLSGTWALMATPPWPRPPLAPRSPPGERGDDQGLGAGIQGRLDDRSEVGGVVDRDVLGQPAAPLRPPVRLRVDAPDPPGRGGGAEAGRDDAEVLARRLSAQLPGPVAEEVGEGPGHPLGHGRVVVGHRIAIEQLEVGWPGAPGCLALGGHDAAHRVQGRLATPLVVGAQVELEQGVVGDDVALVA